MGLLRSEETGSVWALVGRQLIGRSPMCQLRIADDHASQEHAVLWWEGARWWLRDLGSRNGTTVNGRKLGPGEQVELGEGATIEIGDPSQRWTLQGARPPVARAVAVDGGDAVEAEDGLLGLPAEDRPELVVHQRADGRWAVEGDGIGRTLSDLDVVIAGGRSWRLHLPEPARTTLGATPRALRLPNVVLELRVSRTEEHVEALLFDTRHDHRVELPSRAHAQVLLQLARARLADAAVPPAERGWIDRDALCRQLAVDSLTLNTLVHRARRQLAAAGVLEVGALVERRGSELRLGIADVRVHAATD